MVKVQGWGICCFIVPKKSMAAGEGKMARMTRMTIDALIMVVFQALYFT